MLRACALQSPSRAGRLQRSRCPGSTRARRGVVVASAAASAADEVDVVVIGAGIGGLCCGALLARHGLNVMVCESHTHPGGAAHGFERRSKDYPGGVFKFDTGPSFFAGLAHSPSSNPLKQVLDLLGEEIDVISYDKWNYILPEGTFVCTGDAAKYREQIGLPQFGGAEGRQQWEALEKRMQPLMMGNDMPMAAALRYDLGAIFTLGRYLEGLAKMGPVAGTIQGPFRALVETEVRNTFVKNLIDLECFMLSGQSSRGTITAEMAFMFGERSLPGATIDYPMGGATSIVSALVRGLEKYGGTLVCKAHVETVLVEDGRAVGIALQNGKRISAKKAVVSNATVWDSMKLLPAGSIPSEYREQSLQTPQTDSFMHLHIAIKADGLPQGNGAWKELDCHHVVVNDWDKGIEAPGNAIAVSIPTVFDPSLAPEGIHLIHCYTAGNEPYSLWKGMDRKSSEYKQQKEERAEVMWEALERVIPDIRSRVVDSSIGTPLTHEYFLRRSRGTYGPRIKAGDSSFPGSTTPLQGFYCTGDSTQPGIGVPAVAGSGMITANTIVPFWKHLTLLDDLESINA